MIVKRIILEIFPSGSFEEGYPGKLSYPDIGMEQFFKLPGNRDLAEKYQSWCIAYEEMTKYGYRKLISSSNRPKKTPQDYIDSCTTESTELINLFDKWLESEGFRRAKEEIFSKFRENEDNLLIIKTEDINLWQLPWHKWDLIENRYLKTEIIFSLPNFTFDNTNYQQYADADNIKVLSILGDDTGINAEEDWRILNSTLKTDKKLINIEFIPKPDRSELDEALRLQCDIFCFSGHSSTEDDKCFLDINENDRISIEDLSISLRESRIKIAIFNSCDNLRIALSLERVRILIPYLLLMSKEVPDFIAQEFFKHFLEEYYSGKSFYLAVRAARGHLQKHEAQYPCATWLPTIFQHDISLLAPTWNDLLTTKKKNLVRGKNNDFRSKWQKLTDNLWKRKKTYIGIASIVISSSLVWLHYRSIPSSENRILWGSQDLNKLEHMFKWDRGGHLRSNYTIKSDNVLKITTAPGTDHNKDNTHLKQSPRVIFPIPNCQRNFEASIQVKFKSSIMAQRAVFGISDPGRNYNLYIYSLEGSPNPRVESAINSYKHSNPVDYESDILHLKIKNVSGFIDLLYSEDNLEWKRTEGNGLKFPTEMSFSACEIYFEVLSTNLSEGASGEFINFSYKPE